MANLITHVYFAREVEKLLPSGLKGITEKYPAAYTIGSIGPDFLFVLRELKDDAARYCNQMQYCNTYEVFTSIRDYLRTTKNPEALSYVMGLMCHYVLDFNIHAFVNYFVEEGVYKTVPGCQQQGIHAFIENALDDYISRERLHYKDSNLYRPSKELKTSGRTRRVISNIYINAINKIIGFDVVPWKFSFSIFLTRFAIWFVTDKRGWKRKLFGWKEGKKDYAGKKSVRNLMRPPECNDAEDFLNLKKVPYRKVRNLDGTDNMTAVELMDTAVKQAADYIVSFWESVKTGAPLDPEAYLINYEGVKLL